MFLSCLRISEQQTSRKLKTESDTEYFLFKISGDNCFGDGFLSYEIFILFHSFFALQ